MIKSRRTFTPLLAVAISLLFAILATAALGGDDLILIDNPDLGPGPGAYRITSEDGIVRFPFDIHDGDIRFQAEISGHQVHMLIDDGFMWDPLLFWGSPKVDSFGFKYDGAVGIGGGETDDDRVPARTASGITLSFPGVEFTDQTAYVTAYASDNASMWEGSVGQVSCTFLKHFVVDINFDEMMMTLIEPGKFEYEGKGVAVPWRPTTLGPWSIPVTLELADNRTVSVDVLMDLGYNNQLQISPTGPNKITPPEGALPVSLGMNIQRVETLGRNGRIPAVIIGGYKVKNVITGFVNEEHADHTYSEAMLGLGVLSRFNLVFDYTRQRLFVEPSKSFGDAFE